MKTNRFISFIIIAITYLLAFLLVFFLYHLPFFNGSLFEDAPFLKLLILDIIATIFVFIVSLIFNNASIYDPYWSVAPMVMILAYSIIRDAISHPFVIIMIILFFIWGIRLTLNWAIGFKNLNIQDWRYQRFKEKYPKLFPLISFGGIQLMPTLIVYIGMLPAFVYIEMLRASDSPAVLTVATIIAIIVVLIAIIIETIADYQMRRFRQNPENTGKINDQGIWKNSRHPNYLGEILFWFGIYLMLASLNTGYWMLIFAPLVIFLLFMFISIPMMEKRQLANKEGYKEYIDKTNMILIFPAKQPKNNNK